MSKSFEDIEMDFQRSLGHALEDLADDTTLHGHEGWRADSMVLRTFTENLCLICHTAGLPWDDFLNAMVKTWESTEEVGKKIRAEREEVIKKIEKLVEDEEKKDETQLDLPLDKDMN